MAADDVFQAVTVPAGATAITLSFFGGGGHRRVVRISLRRDARVRVRRGRSQSLTLVQLSNETVTPDWTRFTAAVPLAYAGRTVEFGFAAITDDLYDTFFLIDTATLNVTACASAGGAGSP
jgi:hypothetical protein